MEEHDRMDDREQELEMHTAVSVNETVIYGEDTADERTAPDPETQPVMEEPERVDTDALIANDEEEQDPEAAAEEDSEEEEAADLEKKDSEEDLPGIDDETGDDVISLGHAGDEEPAVDPKDLVDVVGVRFRAAGKAYYFAVGKLEIHRGSHVIVETARGLEYGTSVCEPMKIDRKRFKAPVKRIIRIATPTDDRRVKENKEKEREAYRVCFEKIRLHKMDMKLIDAEYTFDNSKILFYFTSDGRVDFRDLVKDLAGVFHTRIELRQVGVRDETKILGGYGICGRPLCCHTYLSDFVPVSIKMAKEQNLSLNPTKISGVCGRLMCCLKNEEETYEELNRNLPRIGDEVQGNDGLTGDVASVNILKQTVRILVEVDDEKELHEYPADQITILRRRKRGQAKPKINRSELRTPGSRPGMRRNRPERPAADTATSGSAAGMNDAEKQTRPGAEDKGRASGDGDRSQRDGTRGDYRRNGRPSRDRRPQRDRTDRTRTDSQMQRPSADQTDMTVRDQPEISGNTEMPDGQDQGTRRRDGRRPYRRRYRQRGHNDRGRESKASETE